MPRVTELIGYRFNVQPIQIPDVDPKDGKPRFDAKGQIKTSPGRLLVLVDPATGEQVRLAFNDEQKNKLVRQLTGGVAIPTIELAR